jgi:hypothetical protein
MKGRYIILMQKEARNEVRLAVPYSCIDSNKQHAFPTIDVHAEKEIEAKINEPKIVPLTCL